MGRANAPANVFYRFEDGTKLHGTQKNRGKPGVYYSFPFTLHERSRMMRMSVRTKNYFAYAVHGKNRIKKLKS